MALRNLPRRARFAIIAALTAALLVAAGLIVWRVLRPSEVVTPATSSYPEAEVPVPGKVGALVTAPLIVDDRLRVFAKKREVWSDGPPSYHYERSAYWSYRRWPAQVVGVTLVRAPKPIVVTAWSDGLLVGIDAETGNVTWRTDGTQLTPEYTGRRTGTTAYTPEYTGRRTGATTVYSPPGLFTTGTTVITSTESTLRSLNSSGSETWTRTHPVTPDCRGQAFTTSTQLFILDTCAKVLIRVDASTGADLSSLKADSVDPISCAIGHSQCQAVRTSISGDSPRGWLLTATDPVEAPALAAARSVVVTNVAIVPTSPTEVTAQPPTGGQPLWTWHSPAPIQLVAAGTDRIFILTTDRTLITLNPANGREYLIAGINMVHEPEQPYEVHSYYTSNRYIVFERVNPHTPESANDDTYYFTHRPVLIALG